MSLESLHIDNSWTLFLDRDGVINLRLVDAYVKTPEEFELLPGVAEAIHHLSQVFGRIIVVSNQQGIGKGLMTLDDIEKVHNKMHRLIIEAGGKIDAVFFASSLEHEQDLLRKPNIGMGQAASKQFPEINFEQSIMAGDSLSDMQFGKRLGMITVLIAEDDRLASDHARIVDYCLKDLITFSQTIINH